MMATIASILLLATGTLVGCTAAKDGPIDVSSNTFPYHEQLDENYQLMWNFNSSHIVFNVKVKTKGYVGFGISHNGAMYPSDVIVAWVSTDSKVHFSDRHADGHTSPKVDSQQDWHLLSGSEVGDYTSVTMIRKLDTCDPSDIAIQEGTTRVIYSYGPTDPVADSMLYYHGGQHRGTKSMLLLDPPAKDQNTQALPDDVTSIDFLNGNYSVPGKDTTYSCTMWKLPKIDGKHHMIRYEPVIQKGHEKLVHHIILYFCKDPVDESHIGDRFDCYMHQPQYAHGCTHVFVAWAIGGTGFDYPDHVGHSLGTSEDPGYFKMETHYDNPDMSSDFVDNSGIRILLTKHLRQYDAGILEAGVHVDNHQIIPPYNKEFLSQGSCHQECLAEALGDNEMYVFANMLHAHLMGSKLRTRILRNGQEITPLQEDNNYDFNFQETRMLKDERTLKKGDALIVDCVYDSSQRTQVTFGGLSSRQEMCLSFLLYYPRIPLSKCMTRTEHNIPQQFSGRSFQNIVTHLDWTQQDVQDAFVKNLHESRETNECSGNTKHYKFHWSMTPKLNVTRVYATPSTCHN